MSVQNITRRAGPYVGTGLVSAYTFAFKVFRSEDVKVVRSASSDANAQDEALTLGTDYTVKLNANQDEKAGGTVTLASPLAEGLRLSILSAITPDQQMVLTNHDGMLPTTLNDSADKAIALIQELQELLGRGITVPATSGMSPEELLGSLLDAAKDAQFSAEEAKRFAEICEEIKQSIFIYSWDIPHVVDTLDDVEKYPFDGFFAVGGYGDPGHHGQDISNRVVKAKGSTELRTLGERFSDVVNVKNFGAKGDGTTDDTAAFNLAAKNGVVYVPAGTYRISNPYDLGRTAEFYGDGLLVFDDAEHRRRGGSSGSLVVRERYTLFYDYERQEDVSVTFDGIEQAFSWVDAYTIEAPGSDVSTDVRIHVKNGRYRLGKMPVMVRSFNSFAQSQADVAPSDDAAQSVQGAHNTALGARALAHLTTSVNCTAVGSRAAQSITTAHNQTAIGFQALYRSNGDGNTAVGSIAGEWLTTGTFNSLYGCEAGKKLTTGSYNVAVGYDSLGEQQTGSYNVAVGYRASGNTGNKEKSYTTALGCFAGDLSSGNNCTYIGYRAGCGDGVSLGEDNVALGMFALRNVTSGQQNTVLGTGAASNLRTHNANVIVGFEAGEMATSSYNVIVGQGAGKAMTGGGAVIIGHIAAPLATGENNVAIGNGVAPLLTSGTKNVFLGANAGRFHLDGTGIETDSNSVFLGYDARSTGENQVQLGNSLQTTYAFGAVQDRSDARDKADVRDTILGSDFILSLRPVDFRWDMRDDYIETVERESEVLDEEGNPVMQVEFEVIRHEKDGSRKRTRYHHGFIAQEVRETMRNLGVDFGGFQDHSINGGNDVLSLGYQELIAPMVKTIQELAKRVAELEKKVL